MLSPYREWIKTIRKKNEFLKNISNCYMKMEKKFVQFFQDKSFSGKPEGQQKKKFSKNISKGHMKKGSAKGMKKTGHGGSLKVMDGHFLHPKGMGAWLMAPPKAPA